MVRQVLQRAGADVLERLGLQRGDGAPPPPPQALDAIFRMPSGGPETEEQARAREAAEEAHRQANPRSQPCQCGCMRWESSRAANGDLIWICSGCHRRFLPRDPSQAVVRPAPPPPPPSAPLPSPEAAREALKAAATAVEMAIAGHASLSNASTSVRAAVGAAERMHEEAEAALAEATRKARDATARALTTGQAAPAIDLGEARSEVEKAADGVLAARGAQEAIEGQQEAARRALASAQAKADAAALQVMAVEVGVPLVARTQALVAELTAALARLGWLSGRRAYWSPEAQALLALQGLPVRDWPMTAKITTESDAALDRALPALVSDPTVVVPAP
jgi:hypothetical protein